MSHSLLRVQPKSKRGKLARNRGVFQLNLPSMGAGIKDREVMPKPHPELVLAAGPALLHLLLDLADTYIYVICA